MQDQQSWALCKAGQRRLAEFSAYPLRASRQCGSSTVKQKQRKSQAPSYTPALHVQRSSDGAHVGTDLGRIVKEMHLFLPTTHMMTPVCSGPCSTNQAPCKPTSYRVLHRKQGLPGKWSPPRAPRGPQGVGVGADLQELARPSP